MPLLGEIADRLVAQGVGAVGTVIFLSSEAIIPTGTGPYVTVSETGGVAPAMTQNDTAAQRPTAQVLSRALGYVAARAKAKACYDALGGANGLHNVLFGSTFYLKITPRQEPTDMGMDGSGRAMIVFNVEVEKAPS